MSWFDGIRRWFAETPPDGPVEECDRLIAELETGLVAHRRALAEASRALAAAERELAALVDDEARWEAAARSTLRAGREADARRHLARRLASTREREALQ